jgi:putative repressor protein
VKYKIKAIREKKGISQEELSKLSGVSRSLIAELEGNAKYSPTVNTLRKIADALNVKVQALFLQE